MNTAALLTFIEERHNIYRMRKAGQPWPWTQDPILQQYRFCNVYRNLDTQTQLIHDHWIKGHAGDPDLWFAMVVARLVNWWPTLEPVGYPVPWDITMGHFVHVLEKRKKEGEKVFTGAYMVRADANVRGSKAVYLADRVLNPLWEARDVVRPQRGDTLSSFHTRLMQYRDMGSFMAAQVVADVKYDTLGHLANAADWKAWAAPGPGSLRGLSRVLGIPPGANWKSGHWEREFALLHAEVVPLVKAAKLPYITGQDLQNCLCEFDKHERVRLGEGKPRSRYAYAPPQEPQA